MSDHAVTRPSLLIQLRDTKNDQAWSDFVDLYAPLIHGYLLKRGLQSADAADLTQDVLQKVSKQAGKFDYDRKRGTFRGWLFTVTLNQVRDFVQRKERQAQASGKTEILEVLHEVPNREAEELWDKEHEMHLFQWACKQAQPDFRENTWQAFWKTSVEAKPAKQVAEELAISVGAVHIAKSRVLSRLREIIHDIEQDE
ncbi:MAG: RNA polymerase sigma factor [Planctomycetota bacterium]